MSSACELFVNDWDRAGVQSICGEPAYILICGSAQVLEGVLSGDAGHQTLRTLWAWRPEHSAGLPLELMSNFAGTDECKPVDSGRAILITSSGNALAMVDRATGNTLFYASVRNAHSAALIPGGLIVAASSFSPDGLGNRFILYSRTESNKPIAFLPAEGAHGVEWDSKRQCLWALSDRKLLRIKLATNPGESRMTEEQSFTLPAAGGHDLVLSQDASSLYLTTSRQTFVFHPESSEFSIFEPLRGVTDIKSLSINSDNGQIVYAQSERGVWWTYQLNFLNPQFTVDLAEHAYKARWFRP
jgi:hypothetical protein